MGPVAESVESKQSRELIRQLRTGLGRNHQGHMPESTAWRVYLELDRRGEPRAGDLFVRALRALHSRRSLAGSTLPTRDAHPEEHRLTDDDYLAALWKAYKKCIRTQRTGPASQLLRDIEEQLVS